MERHHGISIPASLLLLIFLGCGSGISGSEQARALGYYQGAIDEYERALREAEYDEDQDQIERIKQQRQIVEMEGFWNAWYLANQASYNSDYVGAFEYSSYACWFYCPDQIKSFCEDNRELAYQQMSRLGKSKLGIDDKKAKSYLEKALSYKSSKSITKDLAGIYRWDAIKKAKSAVNAIEYSTRTADEALESIQNLLSKTRAIRQTMQSTLDSSKDRLDGANRRREEYSQKLKEIEKQINSLNGKPIPYGLTKSRELYQRLKESTKKQNKSIRFLRKTLPGYLKEIDKYEKKISKLRPALQKAIKTVNTNIKLITAIDLKIKNKLDFKLDKMIEDQLKTQRANLDHELISLENSLNKKINSALDGLASKAGKWTGSAVRQAMSSAAGKSAEAQIAVEIAGAITEIGSTLAYEKALDYLRNYTSGIISDTRISISSYVDSLISTQVDSFKDQVKTRTNNKILCKKGSKNLRKHPLFVKYSFDDDDDDDDDDEYDSNHDEDRDKNLELIENAYSENIEFDYDSWFFKVKTGKISADIENHKLLLKEINLMIKDIKEIDKNGLVKHEVKLMNLWRTELEDGLNQDYGERSLMFLISKIILMHDFAKIAVETRRHALVNQQISKNIKLKEEQVKELKNKIIEISSMKNELVQKDQK